MNPHRMSDSLHRCVIVVEVCVAALGWVSLGFGDFVLTSTVDGAISSDTASTLMLVGALLSVVAFTTLRRKRPSLAPVAHRLSPKSLAA